METIPRHSLLPVLLIVLYLGSEVPLTLTQPADINFSYMKFVYNATEFPLEEWYDYIVIGGGTAGCPLAATLSHKYKVLVLERGGTPSQHPMVFSADNYTTNLLEADDKYSPAEAFISEEGVRLARGRVLGGSSMINAGFYSRAEEEFYAEYGIEWDMDLVMEAYLWVEETIVSKPESLYLWQAAVREAMLESGIGLDNGFTLDHMEGTKTSGSTYDHSGMRHGSVELLNKANSYNIRVGVHAMVEKIIFSSSSSSSSGLAAGGVIYRDFEGRLHKAKVYDNGEIILSAGAIGSPQLLLLSGVGPQSYLSSMKIPVVHNQPHVGQFMQDMPRNDIYIELPFPAGSFSQVVGIRTNLTYIHSGSRLSTPSSVDMGYLVFKNAKVYSTGHLHLASPSNASVGPIVHFNYFKDPVDLRTCAAKMRIGAGLLKTRPMDIFKFGDSEGRRYFKFLRQPLPSNLSDEAAMESFCWTTLTTIWHYHGGCLVGKVVDNSLKVKGVDAIRVVDFSTFAGSPGTNPQATLMMLGRYMGIKIVQERAKKDRIVCS